MPSLNTGDTTDIGGLQSIAAFLPQIAQPTPRLTAPRRATGFRRVTPASLAADKMAESFAGLPDGVTAPGQLLAAFKAAAPYLGISRRLVDAIDGAFKHTRPQDWDRRSRPIVWPSCAMQRETFGLSATRDKALTRDLVEAGLVAMRDSPTGRRYGKRDQKGNIVEAYGFDLSPMAARYPEFVRVATAAKAEREEMARLRRRATIARKAIRQILETVADYGFQGDEWRTVAEESRGITQALKKVERPEEMDFGVASLERLQVSARERLESLLVGVAAKVSGSVNPDPAGAENGPRESTYNPASEHQEATVIAREESSGTRGEAGQPRSAPVRQEPPEKVLRLRPDELVRLAPKLKAYLRRPDPTWSELVDAAAFLRSDLGVSKALWGDACVAMGREQAAIAIAIISTREPAHFRTSPGGYFHGMVAKAKTGDLHLERTIWGMRDRRHH
jgi:replication initiation protein RepC